MMEAKDLHEGMEVEAKDGSDWWPSEVIDTPPETGGCAYVRIYFPSGSCPGYRKLDDLRLPEKGQCESPSD